MALAGKIAIGAGVVAGAYLFYKAFLKGSSERTAAEVEAHNKEVDEIIRRNKAGFPYVKPPPRWFVPIDKNPDNPTATSPIGRLRVHRAERMSRVTGPLVKIIPSQSEIEAATRRDTRPRGNGKGMNSAHTSIPHKVASIECEQQFFGSVSIIDRPLREPKQKVEKKVSLPYRHATINAVNTDQDDFLKDLTKGGTVKRVHLVKNVIKRTQSPDRTPHGPVAWRRRCYITFLEEGTSNVLCSVRLVRYKLYEQFYKEENRHRENKFFEDINIYPGIDGTIPDYIMIVPPKIMGIDAANLNKTPPDFAAVDPAVGIPMGTVQSLFAQFRMLNPEAFALVGKPLDIAAFVARTGREIVIKRWWSKVIDVVKAVLNMATAVASVCYPPVAAVAPIALKILNGIDDDTKNAADILVDAVDGSRGMFSGGWKHIEDAFEVWKDKVLKISPPPRLRSGIGSAAERLSFMADTEFDVIHDQIMATLTTNWAAGLEPPKIPYFVRSMQQLTPPVFKKTMSFGGTDFSGTGYSFRGTPRIYRV